MNWLNMLIGNPLKRTPICDLVSRVLFGVESMERLATPTISLDGDTLRITDESSLATEFAILVDGVEKTTVEVN